MKTVIIAVNAKFIHSSLAPWYLKAYCGNECGEIKVLEFTINDSLDSALASIYFEKADIAAFSCYIWNIAYVFKLAEALKKASPHIKIILGGPEVSYDDGNPADICPWADYVVQGEGEKPFKFLLKQLDVKAGNDKGTEEGGTRCLRLSGQYDTELDSIPSPYTGEMLSVLQGRIVYYESSRGCPFSCGYCLSSTFKGVRHFSMGRVKSDIRKLIDAGVGQVKFVDRTFNCDKRRARSLPGKA